MTRLFLLHLARMARALALSALLCIPATASPAHASDAKAQEAEPVAPLHSYVSPDDYPADAARNGEQGTVEFLLTIGVDGQPTDCVVTTSSGSSSLDSASCLIMIERARFRPARNAAGKPAVGTYKSRIAWRLERSGPSQGAPPAIETATRLWFACSGGEAAKLVTSELSAAEITTRAIASCKPLEERTAVEMRKAAVAGFDPLKLIPGLKKQLTQSLPEMIEQARAVLQGELPK